MLVFLQGDCLSTERNEAFRGVRAGLNGDHIDHKVAREDGGSVEADQVHRNRMWSVAEGHALTVVDEVVSNIRGLTVVDVGSSAAVSVDV